MILYFRDKIIKYNFIVGLFINMLLWVLFYFRIPFQVEPIVLSYNIYVGINLIGPWWHIFNFSLAGLGVIFLNFILAKFIYKRDRLLAYFLVFTSSICQIILLVEGVLLVMMNG